VEVSKQLSITVTFFGFFRFNENQYLVTITN